MYQGGSWTVGITPNPLPVSIAADILADLQLRDNTSGLQVKAAGISTLLDGEALPVVLEGSQLLQLHQDANQNLQTVLTTPANAEYDARKTDPGLASVFAHGTATAPGAAAAITNVLTPPAGHYQLYTTCGVYGTTGTRDLDNIALYKNAGSVTNLPASTGSHIKAGPFSASANGTDTFTLKEGGFGSTAGSFYVAFMAMIQTG